MGKIGNPRPVLLLTAVISQFDHGFEWSEKQLIDRWGSIALTSERFDFSETGFYQKEMGQGLKKQFFGFETLVDPANLPSLKIETNELERTYREAFDSSVERPLNLDPGYLTEAKLILATTKNRDHRIYLQKGIFAEVTLFFQHGKWQINRWTYPDYQRSDFHVFFDECRTWLRKRYQNTSFSSQ